MNWQQLQSENIAAITAWAEMQPWCRAMAACQQDAEWHAEGDVWTHTKMVLDQLTQLDEWQTLDEHQQTVLLFTALFHDVAKPLTTQVDPETGRVTSPKHAVRGEVVARQVLRELGCDLNTREEIARLVRYHGRPAFLLEREQPLHEVVRLSYLVSNRLLYLFALADTRGRDTDAMSRPEENLRYWKMIAEEAGCYESPYPFANDQARFVFARQLEPDLYYVPHEDYSCTVTMMSGLPGSGKDRWLLQNRGELPVISLDAIRQSLGVGPTDNQGTVIQYAQEQCRALLRQKTSFVFNATNTMKQTRARWIGLFSDYKARIEIAYIEPPLERILKQNRDRTESVPEDVIKKLANKCEPPTWLECHRLIVVDGEKA